MRLPFRRKPLPKCAACGVEIPTLTLKPDPTSYYCGWGCMDAHTSRTGRSDR